MTGSPRGEVVAVIPARGGSKGVPGKNLRPVGGVPLVARAVRAASLAERVDRVVVSTDDDAIAAVARTWGAEVVDRPAELAGDTASSESALLHAVDALAGVDVGVLVFLQATSPFLRPADLDDAVARVVAGDRDVVFSAVESWGFLWRDGDDAVGVNHDRAVRPRRQDREPEYLESGGFYVLDAAGFRRSGHRFFGRVGIQPVPERTAIEIDTEEQLELANAIAPLVDGPAGVRGTPAIDVDAVVTDFDGVHTDDTVLVAQDGTEHVRVSRSDGWGVGMLRRAGVPVLILSTEQNPVVASRGRKLGVEVRHGVDDKAGALRAWAAEHGFDLARIAYLGNDVNDLECLRIVGWPVVVPGAHPRVRAVARVVLGRSGGDGAVRELAEAVMSAIEPRSRLGERSTR